MYQIREIDLFVCNLRQGFRCSLRLFRHPMNYDVVSKTVIQIWTIYWLLGDLLSQP
jgi:hypothetical protein